MDMTPKEYQQYVQQKSKKSPILKDVALAFIIGGLICVVGQAIQNGWSAAGLNEEDAGTATSCTMVLLSALLDDYAGANGVLRTAVIWFYICNEGLSVLENLAGMSVPVPQRLRALLNAEKQKGAS